MSTNDRHEEPTWFPRSPPDTSMHAAAVHHATEPHYRLSLPAPFLIPPADCSPKSSCTPPSSRHTYTSSSNDTHLDGPLGMWVNQQSEHHQPQQRLTFRNPHNDTQPLSNAAESYTMKEQHFVASLDARASSCIERTRERAFPSCCVPGGVSPRGPGFRHPGTHPAFVAIVVVRFMSSRCSTPAAPAASRLARAR